jgi:hypothetical protein
MGGANANNNNKKHGVLYSSVPYKKGYTVKKGYRFSVPSQDVTNQTVPGGVSDIPAGGRENRLPFFTVCVLTAVLFQCILILW